MKLRLLKYKIVDIKMFGTAAAEPQEKYFLKAKLDDQIEQAFKEGLNPKHHPGKRNFKHKRLPVFLERAALRIIARKFSLRSIITCGQ